MGIKGLSKAIRRMAPAAVRETQLADYAGRTLTIDACIFMYIFATSAVPSSSSRSMCAPRATPA